MFNWETSRYSAKGGWPSHHILSALDGAARRYAEDRDRPDLDGTSRLSPYLRFGAISVRECFERAEEAAYAEPTLQRGVAKWLDELVWREFYHSVLHTMKKRKG